MVPGIYTFHNRAANCYLSYRDRTLTLSKSPQPWELRETGKQGFYVYAHSTALLLDIDNAWVNIGNTVKVWEHTGYDVQIWLVEKNRNGTYTLVSSVNPQYCLGFDGINAVLQLRKPNALMQEWTVVDVSGTVPKEYLSVKGRNGTVELQLPPDILGVISKPRLQLWVDQLEIAYGSFGELVGYVPFDKVVVQAYQPSPYPGYTGWVFANSNLIHINREYLYGDLKKMTARRQDWNFCVLHEMGHLFDCDQPWNFEAELMTDLKVAYVMEKNHAAAAPGEFGADRCFYGKEIAQAYATLGADFSVTYDIFACTKRFLEIKEKIGWGPFRNTFHDLHLNSGAYAGISKEESFLLFTQTLSRFSGQDIKRYFSNSEWSAILHKCEGG